MKSFFGSCAILLAMAGMVRADSNGTLGTGAITAQETISLAGTFDHGGVAGDALNSIATIAPGTFAGNFTVNQVNITADATPVVGASWFSEVNFDAIDASGSGFRIANSDTTTQTYTGPMALTASGTTDGSFTSQDSWSIEFIDTFDDDIDLVDSSTENVTVEFLEVDVDTDTSGVFALNTLNAIGDSDTSQGEFLVGGIFDQYTFTTTATAGIEVETLFEDVLEGTTVDTEIGLFDSSGLLVAYDDDDGTGLYSLIDGPSGSFAAGTYTVVVSGFGSNIAATEVGTLLLADVTGGTSIGDYGLSVTLTIPEPTAFGLFAIAGLVGLSRRRR